MNILLDIYLEKNIGDDLFLETILARYPKHNFFIFCQLDYTFMEKKYNNLKVIRINKYYNYILSNTNKKNLLFKRFMKRKNIHALVCLGGSIFSEFPGWEKSYQQRKDLWSFTKKQNKKLFVLGSNFGSYKSKEFYELYHNLFGIVDDVCFRDSASYQLFKQLDNVRKEADIVLDLSINKYNGIVENSVGLSVIDLEERKNLKQFQTNYINQLSKTIDRFIEEGKQIYLFSFCEREGDELGTDKVLSKVKDKKNIVVVNYRGNIDEFLGVFSKVESMIATRFHSIILSLMYGKKIFALNYSKKSENLIKDYDLNIETLNIESIDDLNYDDIEKSFKHKNKSLPALKESSKRQFEKLDEFLL
ncbi:polysaccharide pyruvyl transferase family protein [Marinilactibacillus sp. XAAS-LB27]|uniref:polysaccharide pyruvyl transferase family protein n=1 Tax=Marinilactibacillus sp. XAAS-LB27 TaxID=3114538 RepID=UPI002E18CAFB|nr:polysaccharide pyruvyl transferase family protein [Marinilactibacillus sp. XAAS-LB27]